MKNTLLFLGSGGSLGVPIVGCSCPVCTSKDAKNKRLRSSCWLQWNGKSILIDASPDFRQQALSHSLTSADGVILTHAHQDHSGGIDELRVFGFGDKPPLPLLLLQETYEDVSQRYEYIFKPKQILPGITKFAPSVLNLDGGDTIFLGIPIRFFTYIQMGMKVMGFRIHDFAYVTDIKEITPEVVAALKGIKTLIVSALRWTPNPMHLSVDEAIGFVEQVGNPTTWFTHIAHDLDHSHTDSYLPPHIRLGYDGLQITLDAYGRVIH